MARRRKRHSRRRRGTGSIIRVTRLGSLSDPRSASGALLPALIGGGVTIAVTLGIRSMEATDESTQSLIQNAPLVGGGAGLVVGGVMYAMKMQPAGLAAMASAVVAGTAMWGLEYAAKLKAEALAEAASSPVGTSGLRAIVPEYSAAPGRRRGMGAIVMEPHASRGNGAGPLGRLGAYGETVNLGGINASVFGTPGFHFRR